MCVVGGGAVYAFEGRKGRRRRRIEGGGGRKAGAVGGVGSALLRICGRPIKSLRHIRSLVFFFLGFFKNKFPFLVSSNDISFFLFEVVGRATSPVT